MCQFKDAVVWEVLSASIAPSGDESDCSKRVVTHLSVGASPLMDAISPTVLLTSKVGFIHKVFIAQKT